MNPGRAEHACDFVEDGLQEIVCLADSRVKDVVSEILDTSIHPGLGWIPQFGDSLQHAIAVSRDVDLRHDGDEKLFGPAREASHILARINDSVPKHCRLPTQSRPPDGEPGRPRAPAVDRFRPPPSGIRWPRSVPRRSRSRSGLGERKADGKRLKAITGMACSAASALRRRVAS